MNDNSNIDDIHDEDSEAAEEALSLSDFPITPNNRTNCYGQHSTRYNHDQITSSAEPITDNIFEFFSTDSSSEMSHAEDIIFCGKLIPFHNHQQQQQQQQEHQPKIIKQQKPEIYGNTSRNDGKLRSFQHRRSESVCELRSSSLPNYSKAAAIRHTRSLENFQNYFGRTRSGNSKISGIRRISSETSIGRGDNPGQKVLKPRWFVLIFGSMKFPPEMELKDIKNRLDRRNPATMFPPFNAEGDIPASRSVRKMAWGLLKGFGCKAVDSVAVTASISSTPKV